MEESEKKQLVSSGTAAGFWSRRRVGRSWSFSATTSLEEVETTTATVGHAAGALLSRSYSATNTTDAGGSRGGAAVVVKKRLSRKVKEQRARLYIVRRCVSMLLCWRDPDDN